jgi:aspartyl protease family protein
MDGDTLARIAYLALILAALGGWVMAEYRGRMGFALRSALAWGMIFVAAVAAYGIWGDLKSDLTSAAVLRADGRIEVPRAEDGHFYMVLEVNGTPIEFMADTGASSVVLSQDDARRVGIDPDALDYSDEAFTANGPVRTSPVRLDRLAFGSDVDEGFRAWVTQGQMDGSLLGMDYLQDFRIEIDGARMILQRKAN